MMVLPARGDAALSIVLTALISFISVPWTAKTVSHFRQQTKLNYSIQWNLG